MDTDRQAIVDLAVAYCWALDTRDWDALDRVFTADATAVLGSPLLTGVEAIKQRVRQALRPLDTSQHMVNTHQVSVNGDTATSRCYFHAQHVRRAAGGDGASPNFIVAGRYEDRLVRTIDGWRIAHRELVTMWTDGNERVVRGDG
ncbi:nuclear transport factor 2 family protein [soil metagenome]